MRSLAFAMIVPLMATAALAQTPASKAPSGQAATAPVHQQTLQQQVRENLQQDGFTDIKMMPSSFLVRAKDKQGNAVMMVINPDAVTAMTQVPSNNTTTGQGSSVNQSDKSSSPSEAPAGKE